MIRLHSQLAGRSREARGGNWTVRERREESRREEGVEERERRKGGGLTPSCKMEPVIICSFGAYQALPSLSNTIPMTFLPLSHPLPSLTSFPSLPLFHLPASLHLSKHSLPFWKTSYSLTLHVILCCSFYCHMLQLLTTLFLLNASSNLKKSCKSREKELTGPRPCACPASLMDSNVNIKWEKRLLVALYLNIKCWWALMR